MSTATRPSPVDLPLILGYVAVVAVVLFVDRLPVSRLVVVPFLVFVPGYVLLAVLFPKRVPQVGGNERPSLVRDGPSVISGAGLGWRERTLLSLPTSIALLPLVAFALTTVGLPFTVLPAFSLLAALVLVGVLVAHLRRRRVPETDRFGVPVGEWLAGLRTAVNPRFPLDAALNVALICAVVVAMSAIAYGLSAPPADGDGFEAALLTERDGAFVAGDYPDTLVRGDGTSLTLAIENVDGGQVVYTVVVVLERVDPTTGAVVDARELDRLRVVVPTGETRYESHRLTPQTVGEDLRLSYYVYEGGPPADVTADSAHRHLFLWVDVSPPAPAPNAAAGTSEANETTGTGGTNETDGGNSTTEGNETVDESVSATTGASGVDATALG